MTPAPSPRVTLRVARGQAEQQQAIDAWAPGDSPAAVIAEGVFFELTAPPGVALDIERLAAGCVCCIGLVPLRVTLTRLLRTRRPARMLLLIADASHIDRVRALLRGGELGVSLEVDG